MRSRASIGGHPLHPMLIAFPIGLFVWAFVAILVYVGSDDPLWYRMSFWTGAAGVVTALAAAVPGFVDYAKLPLLPATRRVATVHMALNLVLVALFGFAVVLMAHDAALSGGRLGAVIALQAIANGLMMVSGWLGGELVYRHRAAVIEDGDTIAEFRRAEASSYADRL